MKILLICSKNFYGKIEEIKPQLEAMGHQVYLPNCYDDPSTEEKYRAMGEKEHQKFKARMFKQSEETIGKMDAVLVLNYDKEKEGVVLKNYIGGATFLEMYDAFRMGKKIYLMNPVPENILYDEIVGFGPRVLIGDLNELNVEADFEVEEYIEWLSNFMEVHSTIIDSDWTYSNFKFLDEDMVKAKMLPAFYKYLDSNLSKDFYTNAYVGKRFRVQYNSVGYEVGYTNSACAFVQKVAINNSSNYYNLEEIMNVEQNSGSKSKYVVTPKENKRGSH